MSVRATSPDELRRAARLLRGVGDQVEQVADEARQAASGLGEAWSGLAALEHQARTAALRELMSLTARPGRSVAEALDRAADVAESAGARVAAWTRRVDECRAEQVGLRAAGPPPDPLLEQAWRRRLQQVEEDLVRAQCFVDEAEQEWQRVQQEVAGVVSGAWSVVRELNQIRQVVQPVHTLVTKAWQSTVGLYLTTATAIAWARGRWRRSWWMRHYALTRAREWWVRKVTGAPGRTKPWTALRAVKLVPTPVGWVLTTLGAVNDVRTGGGYDDWRGPVTRVLAGAALVGAPLILAGVTLPILAVAGITAVGVYQLWTAGNLVYQHRHTLARYGKLVVTGAAQVQRALDRGRWRAVQRAGEGVRTLRDRTRAARDRVVLGAVRGAVELADDVKEATAPLRDPWVIGLPPGGVPRLAVRDALDVVLGRLPDAPTVRDRLRQVGDPLRLPSVPLGPVLRAPVVLPGLWPGRRLGGALP